MKNTPPLHLVLGGAGATGKAVIKELQRRNLPVKAVGRTHIVPEVDVITADLLIRDDTMRALKAATHIYVCVGLPYDSKIWEAQWPILIDNILAACTQAGAKLIFFDNMYMYGPPPLPVPFDETTPQTPVTRKGKIRKQIADTVLTAHNNSLIQAVIARSADFYGPQAQNSVLYTAVVQRIMAGKGPLWIGKPRQLHTYAFAPDNGRAIVALALDDTTYGDVWHLPVGEPIAIEEILEIIKRELKTTYTISYLPRAVLNVLSLFVPILREVREMSYQTETTYSMSWEKFHQKFPDFVPTTNDDGIRDMIHSYSSEARIGP